MRGSLHTFSGETLPRVQMKVYDLDDATQFAAFAQGDSRRIKVYGSDREIVYDPQKRIGVMTSHIGASPGHFAGGLCLRAEQHRQGRSLTPAPS